MSDNEQNGEDDKGISQQIQLLFKTGADSLARNQRNLELFAEELGVGGEITEDDFRAVPKTFSDRLGSALEERFSEVDKSLKGRERLRALSNVLLTEAKVRNVKKD